MFAHASIGLRCFLAATMALSAAQLSFAEGTLIPLTTRRDMVFDHSGRYLYITTSDGWVKRYNLATAQLEPGYNLGGSLLGADIAPDDSFLLVSQSATNGADGTVHKLDLASGNSTDITYQRRFQEGGAFDVAIAAGGRAFFTTTVNGSGSLPLRQIDLATHAVTVRTDIPSPSPYTNEVTAPTQVHRSADRSRLYFLETSTSAGPVFTYSATTNSFGERGRTNDYFNFATAAVSRDGRLVSTLLGMDVYPALHVPNAAIDTASTFQFVRSLAGVDRGMAFSPVADTLFGVSSSAGQIIAFDTETRGERFRIPIGDSVETSANGPLMFGTGTLVASPDGRYLALATVAGVRLYTIPATPAPSPAPLPSVAKRRDMVFDRSGAFLYVTTSDGKIVRQTLATGALRTIVDLGTALNGIDITRDDADLLVAGDTGGVAEGAFYRVNIASGTATPIRFRLHQAESGAWDIAVGSNGLALATTRVPSGWTAATVLREINLSSNTVRVRDDPPYPGVPYPGRQHTEIGQQTQIQRSADGSRFYFLAENSSAGPIFTYTATANTFGRYGETRSFLHWASAAVSRDGSLLATRHGHPNKASIDSAPGLHLLATLRFDGGCAFDAQNDLLYGVDTAARELVAYDVATATERYRLSLGSDAVRPSYQFDTGLLVASNDGRYLALATPSGIRTVALPVSPPPLRAPPKVFGDVRGLVFDHAGNYLYISTDAGVWPYRLATGKLEAPYDVGGAVYGIDIAPDDSYLLLAQSAVGVVQALTQKLALPSGAITNFPYERRNGEGGAWDVALAANGLGFITSAGIVGQLRQIDMATGVVSVRTPGQINSSIDRTRIYRSANRQRLLFRSEQISGNPTFSYDAATDTFGPTFRTSDSGGSGFAVNRDGTLGVRQYDRTASLFSLPAWSLVHTFAGVSQAVVFNQATDVLYGVNTQTKEIIGFDTNGFGEQMRFPVGEDVPIYQRPFAVGQFVSSPNGRYLAYLTGTALRVYDLTTGSSRAISTAPYLANISTRARIATGDDVAIAGFIIRGSDNKKVVLRGIGPSLGAFGVSGALQDPVLQLHNSAGELIATSDSWRESEAAIQDLGLAPLDDREAALVQTLPPGTYTAILRGQSNTAGVGLVEMFGVDANVDATPVNISTRGFVGTGDNVMIAGVIVNARSSGGYTERNTRLVIRGIGPSLQSAGVTGALANPNLQVFDAQGTLIASNDDWRSGFRTDQIIAAGLAPTDNRESAVFQELPPGAYTAILSGTAGNTGVGLIEVYSTR
jgi:hypothetical protein